MPLVVDMGYEYFVVYLCFLWQFMFNLLDAQHFFWSCLVFGLVFVAWLSLCGVLCAILLYESPGGNQVDGLVGGFTAGPILDS